MRDVSPSLSATPRWFCPKYVPPSRPGEIDSADHHARLVVDPHPQAHAGDVRHPDVVVFLHRVRDEVPLQQRQFGFEGGGGIAPANRLPVSLRNVRPINVPIED